MVDESVAATFDAPHEAELAAMHLGAHGIQARIAGEAVASIAPHLGAAVGGVQVRVALEDLDRARGLLEELRRSTAAAVRAAATPSDEADADA
jgi:hypothetical protein